jgi:hypothetical protein
MATTSAEQRMIAVDLDFESFLPGISPVTKAEFVVFGGEVVGEDWVSAGLAPADAGNEVVDVALVAVAFEADTRLSTDRIDEQFATPSSVDW